MSGERPRVFAVIPVHNRVESTLRCLRSLEAGTFVPAAVVVDDGSTDGTAATLRREHPGAVVLTADGNQWWAGATNLGVRYALDLGADHVLTVNNDGVLDHRAVEILLDAHASTRRAILSSRRGDLAQPDLVRNAGIRFCWDGGRAHYRVRGADPADDPALIPVDACGANAMLVPRACFEEVGLFDAARLPHCWADWDFQLRAAARGWPLYCVPRSLVLEDLTTRGPRRTERLSLRQAVALVASRRSPYWPPPLWHFYRRHAPPGQALGFAARRYALVGRAVARHYLTAAPLPSA